MKRDFRPTTAAGFVLGVALSGFFDGILLHQVLQWHHFLSLVPGETYRDLRTQVYADGLFHVLMYALAFLGLALLWRARRQLDRAGARLAGATILGFGVWNIVDVGFFHWILGIHRIRVNVPNPLAYDLAWFAGPGLLVALLGWWMLRRARGGGHDRHVNDGSSNDGHDDGPGDGPDHGRAIAASIAALLALAVPVAGIPAPGGATLILFRPGVGPASALNAIRDARGGIVMLAPDGTFAVATLPTDRSTLGLYRAGAVLVTRSPALAGCLAFTSRGSV